MTTVTNNVTKYYSPLIPLLNELRKVIFPEDSSFKRQDENLYTHMRDILRKWGQIVVAENEKTARECERKETDEGASSPTDQ